MVGDEHGREYLIWKRDMTTGDPITVLLETTAGTAVMHLMSGTHIFDKDMLGLGT